MSQKSSPDTSKASKRWIKQRAHTARKAVEDEASGKSIVQYSEELKKQIAIFKARQAIKKNFDNKEED